MEYPRQTGICPAFICTGMSEICKVHELHQMDRSKPPVNVFIFLSGSKQDKLDQFVYFLCIIH